MFDIQYWYLLVKTLVAAFLGKNVSRRMHEDALWMLCAGTEHPQSNHRVSTDHLRSICLPDGNLAAYQVGQEIAWQRRRE